MNELTQQLAALSGVKTIQQEILDLLTREGRPMSSTEIYPHISTCDGKVALASKLLEMAQAWKLTRNPPDPPHGKPTYSFPGIKTKEARPVPTKRKRTRPENSKAYAAEMAIEQAISGIAKQNAISRKEIAKHLPSNIGQQEIDNAIYKMVRRDEILGVVGKQPYRAYFDIRVFSDTKEDTSAEPNDDSSADGATDDVAITRLFYHVSFHLDTLGRICLHTDDDKSVVLFDDEIRRLEILISAKKQMEKRA